MHRSIRKPHVDAMPPDLRRVARFVAERLAREGARGWLVGGTVRDLALNVEPHDADLATAATPEVVERCFERTVAVGRAFGTIVVPVDGFEVQVTTFRSERGYSDGRRPDEVQYGSTLEEDARRRDFTCNALYLDPLTDELRDPEGGLADLEAGRLACVGEAEERFAEDGLRLLRLARFAARFGLEVDDATLDAGRRHADRLGGVSPERILGELERLGEVEAPARAVELLGRMELFGRMFTEGAETSPDSPGAPAVGDSVCASVGRLGPAPGPLRFLATLLWGLAGGDEAGAAGLIDGLRPARRLRSRLLDSWALVRRVLAWGPAEGGEASSSEAAEGQAPPPRSQRVDVVADPMWDDARAVLEAVRPEVASTDIYRELVALAASLTEEDRAPVPWLASNDLADAGIPRGRAWGVVLERARCAQLDHEIRSRDEALAWLRAQPECPAS